ncbi:MAG: hydrogenase nickel incorporation protein HypB [Planctomycetota bacterium]|jgi:hydrogenase nickel incorporation protein HypB
MSKPKHIEIRKNILKKNDDLAQALRARLSAAGVYVANFVSSPGTGKTELLKHMLARLHEPFAVGAIVGDVETENDAVRLRESGAPAYQIETHDMCHLDSFHIDKAIADAAEHFDAESLDLLVIENVGNLVCTSGFDLGEDLQVVMVSTGEGEDKPLKYPKIFDRSDVCIINKMDLAAALEFDREQMRQSIETVKPGMPVFELSGKTGFGMDAWIEDLSARIEAKKAASVAT